MPHTILILLSNPKDTDRLRINKECDDIRETLPSSSSPHLFQFELVLSTTIDKLFATISRVKPSIIHFSGHGSGTKRMILEDENGNSFELKASQFVTALRAKPIQEHLKLIVFNACYMETFAELSLKEVPCVIGTKDSIPDQTAIAFSKNFYFDLANGCSVKEAFDRSISLAEIKKLPKTDVPILLGNSDIRFKEERQENGNGKEGRTVIQKATGENSKAIYIEKNDGTINIG